MTKMYVATYSVDVVALLLLLGILYGSNMMGNHRRKPFLLGIVLTLVIILSEAGTMLTEGGDPGLRGISIVFNILGFALAPVLPLSFITISDIEILREHKWLLLPTLINMAAVVLSPAFKWIFYMDTVNQYSRGNCFFIFVTAYIINLLLLVISMLRTGEKYRYPIQGKMTALCIFTVVGTSIQLVDSSVHLSWHCVTVSILLYFILLSEFDSSFDALTGLYNRAAFEKTARRKEYQKALSVIVLDIDDFKSVNDTFGHDYGDIVIKTVAGVIRESLDDGYFCYRVGGDEFYIISNESDSKKIQYQMEKITNSLSKKRGINGPLPTVAYGFSIFKGEGPPDLQRILKEADSQMYQHKKLKKSESARLKSLEEKA
ncbi:hypothetical protein SDC9_56917 [bioreactor metagenome]|uniref:GGDEF domain-containing protein n=1 Tax=bioreactor metagenome TaxID=1076179 RepID=A0A644X356_9ZZZZ